jgi:hypothetical protein
MHLINEEHRAAHARQQNRDINERIALAKVDEREISSR